MTDLLRHITGFRPTCIISILVMTLCCAMTMPAQTAQDPDVLEFTMITDTHQYGQSSDVRSADDNVAAFVDYCRKTQGLSFALFGGDFINDYTTNHDEATALLHKASDGFRNLGIPFYTTRGNHDCNGKCKTADKRPDNTQIITDAEYYAMFSPLSQESNFYAPEGIVTDSVHPQGNYYYRDFGAQRVRLIVLNNYDRDSLEMSGYHGQQMKWLAEKALDFSSKSDAEEWCFVILGHAFTINHKNNAISRLLHSYVRGQDFFDSDNGVTYGMRYSQQRRAKLVALLFGHYHEDIYYNWDGYNVIGLTRGYALGLESVYYNVCFTHFVLNTRTQTLEERHIGRGFSRTYSYDTPQQITPGLVFRQADGMGRYTVGGKHGRLLHVTNLDDSGDGSLRWAISQHGARTVIFDVSGTIRLTSPLCIEHDSITILGQSAAAGDGIVLKGQPLLVNASQVVLRYLTVEELADCDFGHSGLVVDHITAVSDSASAISIRRTADVTVQRCLISTHSVTEPALQAGGFKATYWGNYIYGSARAIKFSDNEGENRWIQVGRNLITGWDDHAMYGGGREGEFTIHENYLIPSPHTSNFKLLDVADDGTGRYYVVGNGIKGYERFNRRNAALVNDKAGSIYIADPRDTLYRSVMAPVARPHDSRDAASCLSIATFSYKYMFGSPTHNDIRREAMREAGSAFRPEPVNADSLRLSDDVADYLDRIVQPERSIVVLFETDVHCQIDGYPYLCGVRDITAADTAHVAVVSCGDFMQGGQAGSLTRGQAVIDIMKNMHYDAVSLGGHEFDYELEHDMQLLGQLDCPITSANILDGKSGQPLFKPYVIRQYGRRKVAYVGVTSPMTGIYNEAWLKGPDGKMALDFDPKNLYRRVQQAADDARSEGADYVIVLSQLGNVTDDYGISAPQLIAYTRHIDAVLDGRTHQSVSQLKLLNADGDTVTYCQGGKRFDCIGKLVIDPDGGISTSLLPTTKAMFRDPAVAQVVDSVKALYSGSADAYVGRSLVELKRPKAYVPGTPGCINNGNLIVDALRWYSGADVGWINTGSMSNDIPAGELTRADIRDMVPYENYIVTLNVTGKVLEQFIHAVLKNLDPVNGTPTPVSGLRISIFYKGSKVKDLKLQVFDRVTSHYVDVDPERIYSVSTTSYCLNIVMKHKRFARGLTTHQTGELYSEALIKYIEQQLHGVIEPTEALKEERVVRIME